MTAVLCDRNQLYMSLRADGVEEAPHHGPSTEHPYGPDGEDPTKL